MKLLSIALMVVLSAFAVNAQTSNAGVKANKKGVEAKGAKGGKAAVTKNGAEAKGPKGKGVEADKKGTKTTQAKK